MTNKNNQALDDYMRAGALMRLYKIVGAELYTTVGKVVSTADRKKLLHALHGIDTVCSNAEDNMFRDHPYLSDQYTNVFYGTTESEPRSEVDKAVLVMAREAAEEITTPRHIPG